MWCFFFFKRKRTNISLFLIEEYVWEDIVDEFEEEGRMELKLWRKKRQQEERQLKKMRMENA